MAAYCTLAVLTEERRRQLASCQPGRAPRLRRGRWNRYRDVAPARLRRRSI